MTVEKVYFLNPEDITAVRIQCNECRSALIVPLQAVGNIGATIVSSCQHCHTPSGVVIGTREMQELIAFNETLAKLAANLKGRNIKYSLQVQWPTE